MVKNMSIIGMDGVTSTATLFNKALSLSTKKGLDAIARKTQAIELLVQENQYFLSDGKLEDAVFLANDILMKRFIGGANIKQTLYPMILTELLESISNYNNNAKLSKMKTNEKINEFLQIADKLENLIIPSLLHLNDYKSSIFTAMAYNYHGLASRNTGEIKAATGSFIEAISECHNIIKTDNKGLLWLMYSSFNLGRLLINEEDGSEGIALIKTSLNLRKQLYEENVGKYNNPNLYEGQYGKVCAELALQLLKVGNLKGTDFDSIERKKEFEEMITEADKVYEAGRLDNSYTFRDYARMKILVFEQAVEHGLEFGIKTTIDSVVLAKKALIVNELPNAPVWKESDLMLFKKYIY